MCIFVQKYVYTYVNMHIYIYISIYIYIFILFRLRRKLRRNMGLVLLTSCRNIEMSSLGWMHRCSMSEEL
jgi:hypothetical protein